MGQGTTFSGTATPWPTTPGVYQTTLISPNQNAPFVAKVSADGSQLLYSTLAGSGHVSAMTLDPQGEVLLAGTPGSGFPITSAAYQTAAGNSFIAKASANGTALPYATYFGSSAQIAGLALDAAGDLWLTGRTTSRLTLVNPLQSSFGSSSSTGFVAELDPLLQTLQFSSYFNGPQGSSIPTGLAIDPQSHIHLAGTAPDDLPTTTGAYLTSVTPPPPNYTYTYGFAAVINPATPAPAVCDGGAQSATAQVGSSSNSHFKITNCGTAVLTISGIQLQSTLFSLSSSTACIGALAVGASCTVNYTFTPVAAGSVSAVAVVSSDAPVSSHAVTVYGLGTAPQIVPVSTQITFPTQVLGVAGNSQPFPIVNQGTVPLTIDTRQTTITTPFPL